MIAGQPQASIEWSIDPVVPMSDKIILTVILVALSSCQSAALVSSDAVRTRYINGRIFDGTSFHEGELCVEGARIVDCDNGRSAVVDLDGAYVTPPFGDAHTHHFDSEFTLDWHTAIGLQSGAFYAINLTARSTQVELIRDRLRGPGRVDVISSTGGITGPESHPAEIYEAVAIGAYSYEDQLARAAEIRASRRVADDAYYVVENVADFDEKWPLLLSRKPDLVKVFLRTSERYDEGYGKWGPGGGVDPDLLPFIRARAEAAGLRLAVASSTLSDFATAVSSGADIISHLPCYQDTSSDPDSPYYAVRTKDQCKISAELARQAAEEGLAVVLITSEWAKERPQQILEWEQHNIRTLESAGVTFAVGSNAYGATLTDGLIACAEKGFLPKRKLLRIATRSTPRLVFPDRRVGCLQAGCEASFIGFASNPLEDFRAIKDIVFRLKDGQPVASRTAT